jgi:energy-converting hydrogenase Eha subunit C
MARKKRRKTNWRDWLGLIPITVIVLSIAFGVTKHEWFDKILPDNKALFWVGLITALATVGLFVVAVVAAVVTYYQFREFQRGAKVQTTTDLLKEWSDEKYQRIIGYVDYGPSPDWCRKYARLLYIMISSPEQRPPMREREKRMKWREREDFVHQAIQDFTLMATRTWNLLEHGIIDADVLFGQLDYDIIASYYELEDVLAIRQYQDSLLYAEFTRLAKRAQAHYRRRPSNETCPEFVTAVFETLPFEESEFRAYMKKVQERERGLRDTEDRAVESSLKNIQKAQSGTPA